jgi:hypothetical protein
MNRFFKSYVNKDLYKGLFLVAVINLCFVFYASAQSYHRINGTLKDSLNKPIREAIIEVIADADTLTDYSDYRGKFNISGILASEIFVTIKAMGFLTYQRKLQFSSKQSTITIQPQLEPDANTLKEVVIRANVNPIRIAKDTIEYNAAAFLVREVDRVEDLLRQLPGVVIDNDGKVIAMGRVMTKLRINGEDFFTNNVKDFISQLPADMVAKVQVINDYGDEANFTGIKTGESQKMLNLVTKPGRNKGNFGNTSANGGTNQRYGLQTNANVWREKKQIGIKGNVISTNNAAGVNRNISTGVNYRDKLSKEITGSVAYTFDNVKNNNNQLDFIETLNNLGTIYTVDSTERTSNSNKHNLNWSLQSIGQKSYFQAGVIGSFLNSDDSYDGTSAQRGVIRQDQRNNSKTEIYAPEFNLNIAWAYRFIKPGRNISVGAQARNGISDMKEDISSRIGYYENNLPGVVKDSLLNRLVDTRNRSRTIGGSVRFSEPVGNKKDSLVSRNFDIYYNFQFEKNDNNLQTRVNKNIFNKPVVDSLSTIYTSKFISHLIGLSYRFGSEDLSYSLGITAQPNLLVVENQQPRSLVQHAGFNVAPVLDLSMVLSKTTSITFLYNGSSMAPNLSQLQPVPNTRNLQNIVIGNPNLKSTFNHTSSFTFQNNNPKNGRSLMLGVNSNVIQDQVVSNIILKQDTLNSYKQETRFENANGAYSIDALYSWSKPYEQNTYNLEFRGSMGFGNNVSFTDGILNNNKGFNFMQAVMIRMNQKGFSLGTDANYTYNSNRYSLDFANLKDVQIYEINMNAKAFFTPTVTVGFDASKRIYKGYSIFVKNPLLINLSLQKSFLKKEQASIKLQAYDLLNQGNYLMRSISDNSIIDTRNNQITRYLQLSFTINLQQFGG